MADNSYTASERRGIIAIAFLALLITAAGIGVSFYSKGEASVQEPVINTLPDPVDSLTIIESEHIKKESQKSKRSSKASSNKKSKKEYRRRSPLDEPV